VRGYVLTERGKLLVAMLIVLFLILPSIIFVVYASTQNTQPEEPPTDSSVAQPPPINNDSASLDINAGKMTFLYAPDSQTTLDENTSSMIGQLLTSTKNTPDSKIAVEIPQLTDEETAVLTTVILNTFINHDVSLSDIVFYVYRPESDTEPFKINISFN